MLDFHFSKFQIFNGRNGQEGQRVSQCQISRRSLKPLPKCGAISIFHNGGRHHVRFLKFLIFSSRLAEQGRNASPCKILWHSVKSLPRYGNFSIFPFVLRVFGPSRRVPTWSSLSLCKIWLNQHCSFEDM